MGRLAGYKVHMQTTRGTLYVTVTPQPRRHLRRPTLAVVSSPFSRQDSSNYSLLHRQARREAETTRAQTWTRAEELLTHSRGWEAREGAGTPMKSETSLLGQTEPIFGIGFQKLSCCVEVQFALPLRLSGMSLAQLKRQSVASPVLGKEGNSVPEPTNHATQGPGRR